MNARTFFVALALCSSVPAHAVQSQALTEAFEVVSDPGGDSVAFGAAVALDGTTLIVGDRHDSPPGLAAAGAAFLYEAQPDGTWTETTELVNPFVQSGALYGASVAIHGDTAVVGAPERGFGFISDAGLALVFERDLGGADQWGVAGELVPSDLSGIGSGVRFGTAVAVWDDWVAVGTDPSSFGPHPGRTYLFRRDEGGPDAWGETQILSSSIPTDRFGSALALEGDLLVVGAPGFFGSPQGFAFVCERDGAGVWNELQQLAPSGSPLLDYGSAVGICGDTIVVGDRGAVRVFDRAAPGAGLFTEVDTLLPPENPPQQFGLSLGLSADRLVVGAKDAGGIPTGEAHLFERQGAFQFASRLRASDGSFEDELGTGVAISGSIAVAGAPNGASGVTVPYIQGFSALAYDPGTDALYGSAAGLVRLDPSTGTGSYVGAFGVQEPDGMAFDPGTGILYGVNLAQGLLTIDTTTGAATLVGPLPGRNLKSLAFDQASGMLYGIDVSTLDLVRIDPLDASLIVVGSTGGFVYSLAFDSETGVLYGKAAGGQLYRVDTGTAALTPVAPTSGAWTFLADRPGADQLYNGDSFSFTLTALSTVDGSSTPIGVWGASSPDDPGSAYVFELPTIDTVYCTAGTSASGCRASLSATGVASASASAGFAVTAVEVEGAKDGLFFFGTSGRQANPWGNGTSFQCVVPPVKRAGLLSGTGTAGQCDGVLGQDLNAHWCPSCPFPLKNPGAGATVQAQLWYRDPLNTSNQTTSLSDAIEFVVGP